jgi:hypothetical protein
VPLFRTGRSSPLAGFAQVVNRSPKGMVALDPKKKGSEGMSSGIDPYRDHCTVRVRVFLRNNGRQGRIDGPPTAGQNDYQELRMRPDKHDDFQLVGVYDLTGSYIPFFPFDLNGQEGIDGWFRRMEKDGFKITKLR